MVDEDGRGRRRRVGGSAAARGLEASGGDQEVVGFAIGVDDVVPEDGFALEAESSEDALGGGLVEHHSRGQELEFKQLGDGVDLFGEDASETASACGGAEQESDFAEVSGPVGGGVVEVAFAEQLVAVEAEDGVGASVVDFAHPLVDGALLGDVATEEEEVVGGKGASEVEDELFVAGCHESHADAVPVA